MHSSWHASILKLKHCRRQHAKHGGSQATQAGASPGTTTRQPSCAAWLRPPTCPSLPPARRCASLLPSRATCRVVSSPKIPPTPTLHKGSVSFERWSSLCACLCHMCLSGCTLNTRLFGFSREGQGACRFSLARRCTSPNRDASGCSAEYRMSQEAGLNQSLPKTTSNSCTQCSVNRYLE